MVITPIPCPICREAFTPRQGSAKRKTQETCSPKCGHQLIGRRLRGQPLVAATAVRRARAAARLVARVGQMFGDLTPRETQIFEHGRRIGYTDGYNAATRDKKRSAT